MIKPGLGKSFKKRSKEFEEFYEATFKQLFCFAYTILKNYCDAEDAVADAYMVLWENWDKSDHIENITGYLYQIVKNNSIKIKEKKLRYNIIENFNLTLIVNTFSPEQELLSKEINERIQQVVYKLPPRCKRVYILAKEQNMSYSEISSLLNISVKTVQAQMIKALKQIRKVVKEYDIHTK